MKFLIPILIVAGWFVSALVAFLLDKKGRRKNEMLRLIDRKNLYLLEVEELCWKVWWQFSPGEKPDVGTLELLPGKIERIRQTYIELNDIQKCRGALLQVVALRKAVTFDVERLDTENDSEETAKFAKARAAEIDAIIEALRDAPKKPI